MLDAAFALVDPRARSAGEEADQLQAEGASPESIGWCIRNLSAGRQLTPVYDRESLDWLLAQAREKTRHGDLHGHVLRDSRGDRVGWFLYYCRPGGIAQVLQFGGQPKRIRSVLECLFRDAAAHGAVAVSGGFDPRYMKDLARSRCRISWPGYAVVVRSRRPELAQAVHRGDAFLTRLEGEWWARFSDPTWTPPPVSAAAGRDEPVMCGIAGILNPPGAPVNPALLRRMIDRIRYRGPDFRGAWTEGRAGLAHARRSIIDLGGGRQPMHNADRSLTLTFNGEIFNYVELRNELRAKGVRFTSDSDTEVLLRLYEDRGAACVDALNGDFAFAIWDARTQTLRPRATAWACAVDTTPRSAGRRAPFCSPRRSRRCRASASQAQPRPRRHRPIFTFWSSRPPRTCSRASTAAAGARATGGRTARSSSSR